MFQLHKANRPANQRKMKSTSQKTIPSFLPPDFYDNQDVSLPNIPPTTGTTMALKNDETTLNLVENSIDPERLIDISSMRDDLDLAKSQIVMLDRLAEIKERAKAVLAKKAPVKRKSTLDEEEGNYDPLDWKKKKL